MSGPKHSFVRISEAERRRQEAERQRRLEEERRRKEEEQMRALDETIARLASERMSLVSRLEQFGHRELESAAKTIPGHFLLVEINKKKQENVSRLAQLSEPYAECQLSLMQAYAQRLEQAVIQTRKQLASELPEMLAQLKEEIKKKEIADAERAFFEKARTLKQESTIAYDLSLHHSVESPLFVSYKEEKESFVEDQWELLRETLEPYLHSLFLSDKQEIQRLYEATEQIMSDNALDQHYQQAQAGQRLKAFLATKSKYDKEIAHNQRLAAEYEKLRSTYHTLCEMLGEEAHPLPFSISNGEQGIEHLKSEIANLKEKWKRKEEAEYIAQSVHEIMNSLGYDILATDFMQTPKRDVFHHIYELSGDNVVNVFTSDNGSLLFEVTGVSEGKKETTSLEKTKIKEGMEEFCADYEVIKECLRARGIELTEESIKPASEVYARTIDISGKNKVKQTAQTRATLRKRQQKRSEI
jgi:hypothetical protein